MTSTAAARSEVRIDTIQLMPLRGGKLRVHWSSCSPKGPSVRLSFWAMEGPVILVVAASTVMKLTILTLRNTVRNTVRNTDSKVMRKARAGLCKIVRELTDVC